MSADQRPDDTWEVFVRPRRGLAHSHVGSVRGHDAEVALAHARDLYARRGDPASLWLVPARAIRSAAPEEKPALFSNAEGKDFRYPERYVPLTAGDPDAD